MRGGFCLGRVDVCGGVETCVCVGGEVFADVVCEV